MGNVCDRDDDNDGIPDVGDYCDTSIRVATICDPGPGDNCPLIANPDQADVNQNGIGDVCDDVCLNIQ